jgi:anti-sigma B factor antagonist
MNTFSVETELLPDDTRVVAVAGELDLYTAPPFEEQILDALDTGTARIVVDLSACEFLDSTALGILVKARKRLGDQERRLVLVATDHNIVKVFQITGLDRTFTIVPTRESALNGALPDRREEDDRMRGLFREANEQVRELHQTFGQDGHTRVSSPGH